MHYIKKPQLNESGFAPLIVAIVIIVVLSLVTVGFVLLMNQNQQNVLNRQLSSDAYYAAKTGVNDAVQAIAYDYQHGINSSKTTCGPDASNPYLSSNQVNESTQPKTDYYSCLLINPVPDSLDYSSVGSTEPTVALVSSNGAVAISRIQISWQQQNGQATFAPSSWFHPNSLQCKHNNYGPCFYPENQWQIGSGSAARTVTSVLEASLTPIQALPLPTGTDQTYTAFLYPLTSSGVGSVCTASYSGVNCAPAYSSSTIGANSGVDANGNCSSNVASNGPLYCNVTIDVSGANTSTFILSMLSVYNASQVKVEAFNSSTSNTPIDLRNDQVLVDSTGDDQGVLKRIQVRVPVTNYSSYPGYGLASTRALCKDLETYPANNITSQPGLAKSTCGL